MENFRPNIEKLRNLVVEQSESIKELRRSIAEFSTEMKRIRAMADWIKVEDELPECGKSVLVCGYWKGSDVMEWWASHRTDNPNVLVDKNGFSNPHESKITHWMRIELPE